MTELLKLEDPGEGWLGGASIEAPIRSVLVMEDRAQITRQARLTLAAGTHALTVSPVTPLAVDRSLRCRVCPENAHGGIRPESARILDLQVRRRYLTRSARPERQKEIKSAIEKLEDAYLEAFDLAQSGFHKRLLLGRMLEGLTAQIGDRLVVGEFDPLWPDEIRSLFNARSELENSLLEIQWQQQERRERLQRLAEEQWLLLQPAIEYLAGFRAELLVADAGTFLLDFEYQVPCALWRPEYAAELHEKGGRAEVKWESAGTVWQATGEDWRDVELKFSTARPALGAELPLLQDDVLAMRDKTEVEKRIVEVSSRDEAIARTGDLTGERESDTPPGLDDGGEPRTYMATGRVDVPSDGCPHRLGFEQWQAPAEVGLVAMPEIAEYVFLRSFVTNPSSMPLLAGPVYLVRNGGHIGRSRIRYVAPGESFALSWGSEDALAVLRNLVREFEETELRKRKIYRFIVENYIANQGRSGCAIRVFERIPVSEIAQVEVAILDDTTGGFKKDEQGLLHWDASLSAGAEARLRLSYQVSMPHNVQWNS